jgi:hypothetical protein
MGCTNDKAMKGGVCKKTHGAEKKQCSFEGCTNRGKGGVCIMYHAWCKEEEEEEVHFFKVVYLMPRGKKEFVKGITQKV